MTEAGSAKSSAAEPLAASLRLRIGLSILDGASSRWICEAFGVTADDVAESWALCRESLSRHFAKVDGGDHRLMDEAEIRERLDDALRLLIDWRANALQNERTAVLAANASTLGDRHPASATPVETTKDGASDETPGSE